MSVMMLVDLGTPPRVGTRAPTRPRWLDTAVVGAAAALALLLLVRLGLIGNPGADWITEARPSVEALLHDHVGRFLRSAPSYGGSLLLRAPVLELTRLWHAGPDGLYAAGAVPSLVALTALALWLSHRLAAAGGGLFARATVVALCIANPFTIDALQLGHPEDLLGATLCVTAVLCALEDRAVPAGLLVGVACANKAWGVLAAGPVLVALSRHRPRALLAMLIAGGALMAPFMLVRTGGVGGQVDAAGGSSGGLFAPFQLWWWFGHHLAGTLPGVRAAPSWLARLGHTLPILLMAPLTLAFWARRLRSVPDWRRSGSGDVDALLLLALLMLLRCALDPWDGNYYAVPFLTALLAWESMRHVARPPVWTLAAAAIGWLEFTGAVDAFGDAYRTLAAIYTCATVATAGLILLRCYGPAARRASQTAETSSSSATRNEEPQPQAATTLGLSTLKPAP